MGKKIITVSMVAGRIENYNKQAKTEKIVKDKAPGYWSVKRLSNFSSLCLSTEGIDIYLNKRGF